MLFPFSFVMDDEDTDWGDGGEDEEGDEGADEKDGADDDSGDNEEGGEW